MDERSRVYAAVLEVVAMPTLEWIGKDKVINHHLDVPYRVLERKYSYDEDGQHEGQRQREHDLVSCFNRV